MPASVLSERLSWFLTLQQGGQDREIRIKTAHGIQFRMITCFRCCAVLCTLAVKCTPSRERAYDAPLFIKSEAIRVNIANKGQVLSRDLIICEGKIREHHWLVALIKTLRVQITDALLNT